MKSLLTLLTAALLLSSCSTYTDQCQNEGITFRLTGFSRSELDTVVIRQFFRNSAIEAKDPVLIPTSDNFYNGDTATLSRGSIMADSFDVQISIPSLNRSIHITDIISEPPHSVSYKVPIFASVKRDECYNKLLSYKIDGQQINDNSNEWGNNTIDIQK